MEIRSSWVEMKMGVARRPIMVKRCLAVTFMLYVSVLHPLGRIVAQNVKSTFDKSVDFAKYKKYTWGSNYLLTQQTKDVQERINSAIVDSINRNLRAGGFVEDDKNPDFRIAYEAGGQPKADVGAQRKLYASDMVGYYWRNLSGISSDVWVSSLAKLKITVTDAEATQELGKRRRQRRFKSPRNLRTSFRRMWTNSYKRR
jgi:hypothetical protein